MNTHTPGPWTFEPGDTGDPSVGVGAQLPTVFVGNPNPYYDGILLATLHDPICNNDEDGHPQYFGNADANARLIAAAPDLLAALQEAVRVIRAWHGMGMGPHEAQAWALYQASPEMQRINAAIAKAEGRS